MRRVAGAVRQLGAAQLGADGDGGESGEGGAEASSGRTLAGSPGTSKRRRVAEQRDEQEQRDRRLLEVETLREVRGRGGDDDRDRELPGAAPATRERA